MKWNRWLALAVVFAVAICAFVFVHSANLPKDGYRWEIPQEDGINLSAGDDELVLTVRFNNNGEVFEIAKDITAAEDEDFKSLLKMKNSVVRDGNYMYRFRATDANRLQTLYLKPPVCFEPIETPPIAVPLVCGQVAKMSSDAAQAADEDWFTVKSINIEKDSKDYYKVQLALDAHRGDLPRYMEIMKDGIRLAEISSKSYKGDSFLFDEVIFFVNAESEAAASALVEESLLVITGALLRVDVQVEVISSSVENLSVTVVDD